MLDLNDREGTELAYLVSLLQVPLRKDSNAYHRQNHDPIRYTAPSGSVYLLLESRTPSPLYYPFLADGTFHPLP